MPRIIGRSAFVQLLVDEGVTHLFGNPAPTDLPIMKAVPEFPQPKFVLGLQQSIVLAGPDSCCRASHWLAGDPHRGAAGNGAMACSSRCSTSRWCRWRSRW